MGESISKGHLLKHTIYVNKLYYSQRKKSDKYREVRSGRARGVTSSSKEKSLIPLLSISSTSYGRIFGVRVLNIIEIADSKTYAVLPPIF